MCGENIVILVLLEEKSLRHVAMVEFWMTTNQKHHLKSEFALFQTSLILFSFIQFVNCWRNFLG